MKKLIQPLTALLYSLVAVLLGIGVYVMIAFSWFTNTELVEPDLSGFSVSAYFGGGNGTENDPFLIKNQRHLYNLCWLQYLGYFNKVGTLNSNGQYISGGSTLTQYSFSVENDLNMNGWYLPPIGTTLQPFIGLLNGNGHSIYNLHTTNNFSEFGTRHPSSVNASNFANVDVIGFMGVVGTIDSMANNDKSIDTTDNAVANIKLKDNTVKTVSNNALIGIAAGYINGYVEDLGIVNSGLDISSSKLASMDDISYYTVAGYATDEYVVKTSTTKAMVLNPTNTVKTNYVYSDPGDTTGWGGSIDMASLYTRINSRLTTAINSYTSGEINYYDISGNLTNTITQTTNLSTTHYYNQYGSSGAYLTQNTAPINGYDYLTGLYKDVTTIEVTGTTSGYKIKSPGNNYLNITSTRNGNNSLEFTVTLSTNTNSNTATVWIRKTRSDGGYNLYTSNGDDGYDYYLNATTTSLSIGSSGTTAWQWDANYGFYIVNNNKNYYLRFIDGEWKMSDKLAYYITDNNGHYLSRNNTSIVDREDYTQATRWIFENEATNPNGIIYDESNTNYKLSLNGNTLAISTGTNTLTNWLNDGNNIYNGNNYIVYDNGWKIYQHNKYEISYNNRFLSLDTNGNILNNETDEASVWTFSDISTGNAKGYVSTEIEGNTYYLSFDNNNGLVITSNQTTYWQNDGDGIYYTYNNIKYYLQYKNNTWQVAQAAQKIGGYKISRNGTYLNNNGTTGITAGTNVNNATVWYVDSNNHIYCIINNTNYYLYYSNWRNSTLGISTSSSQTYMPAKSGNSLITDGYYITYNGGWKDTSSTVELTWTGIYVDDLDNTPIPTFNSADVPYVTNSIMILPNMNAISATTNVYDRDTKTGVPEKFNYIPLNTESNGTVKETNSGYIMSGGHSGNSGGLDNVDIRVAGNASSYTISGRLTTSVENSGLIKTNKVYTYNGSLTTINDTTYKPANNSNMQFEKYEASRANMVSTFQKAVSSNNSRLGGIHFITSLISMDNLITAPSVMINGQTYTNYEMPENSIDFNLKTRGYVNFFAGMYYPGNTTFFSLYEIKRDDNKKIIAINHIKEIYKNPNNQTLGYIYKYESADQITGYYYSNGSNTLTSGFEKIFDTSWIETPSFANSDFEQRSTGSGYKNNGRYMTKLFYFEIPMNEGEYALGSVNNRDGGYLLYLDVGANAQQINRTEITQKSTVTESDYIYPKGIAIITDGTTIDDAINSASLNAANSSVLEIKTVSGQKTIVVNRTSTTSINAVTDIDVSSTYIPRTQTLTKNSSAMIASAVKTTTSIYSQIVYIDHNVTMGEIYETIIEKVDSTDSTKVVAPYYKVYKIGTQNTTVGFDRVEIDQSVTNPEWRLYAIEDTTNVIVNFSSASDTHANAIKTQLTNIAASTGTTILDYEYDTVTGATNTYAIHIAMALNNNDLYYYSFTGDDITVTTDSSGGITIIVNVSNTNYTFRLNDTTNMVVGTNINVAAS